MPADQSTVMIRYTPALIFVSVSFIRAHDKIGDSAHAKRYFLLQCQQI